MIYLYDWSLSFFILTFGHNNFTVVYMLHTKPYLFMGFLCHLCPSITFNVLWHLVAHKHLTWANFSLHWHFPFIFWTALCHCLSPFFLISTNFFTIYSSFSTTINSLHFPTSIFEVHLLETGSHAIVYFLSIDEDFVTKVSPEPSVLFLYKCFLHIVFICNVQLHVTHTGLFFHGGSGSCDFLNFIWIIYVSFTLNVFFILLLINI